MFKILKLIIKEIKMTLKIDSQLFPCVEYIKYAIMNKHVEIEQYETFQKMSFRNRYIIAGANGLSPLTIPIIGGREQKVLIKEVEVDYSSSWNTKHWRNITSSYSKAPYFDYYKNGVQELLFNGEKNLFLLNNKILAWILKSLKVNAEVIFSEEYRKEPEGEIDFRSKILPKTFQSNSENWKPVYSQVFEDKIGFQPNLSIIDLMFAEGPNALNLLKKSLQ